MVYLSILAFASHSRSRLALDRQGGRAEPQTLRSADRCPTGLAIGRPGGNRFLALWTKLQRRTKMARVACRKVVRGERTAVRVASATIDRSALFPARGMGLFAIENAPCFPPLASPLPNLPAHGP